MITNASIIRIDKAAGASPIGETVRTQGDTWEANAVRCLVDVPTNSQKWQLGAEIQDADKTLFVGAATLPAGTTIDTGDIIVTQVDGEAESTGEVILVKKHTLRPISHYELFLKTL